MTKTWRSRFEEFSILSTDKSSTLPSFLSKNVRKVGRIRVSSVTALKFKERNVSFALNAFQCPRKRCSPSHGIKDEALRARYFDLKTFKRPQEFNFVTATWPIYRPPPTNNSRSLVKSNDRFLFFLSKSRSAIPEPYSFINRKKSRDFSLEIYRISTSSFLHFFFYRIRIALFVRGAIREEAFFCFQEKSDMARLLFAFQLEKSAVENTGREGAKTRRKDWNLEILIRKIVVSRSTREELTSDLIPAIKSWIWKKKGEEFICIANIRRISTTNIQIEPDARAKSR